MVALNKNVAMEDMCEHQTTLCKVKREFFVKQEKISTFLPSKDNRREEKRREEKRREGDKDKGETLIDWPLVQVESRSCSTIKISAVFSAKTKYFTMLYSISAGNSLITHKGSPKNI